MNSVARHTQWVEFQIGHHPYGQMVFNFLNSQKTIVGQPLLLHSVAICVVIWNKIQKQVSLKFKGAGIMTFFEKLSIICKYSKE